MKPFYLAITAGALSAMTAVAVAQTATPAAPEASKEAPAKSAALAKLDANNDGVIDQNEFAADARLKEADTNNDGVLSQEEVSAMILKQMADRRAERMMQRLDIDGDGKVTLAEIEGQKAKRFALMDRNNDGKLEASELRRGGRDGGDRNWQRHDRKGGDRAERGDRGGRDHGGKHWKRHGDHGGRNGGADMPDRT